MALSLKGASQRIKALSEQYGLNVEPDAKIEDISVGMQQRVEILKMLYRNAEVLIFDEPTAVLTPQETLDLMKIMRNLIKEGKSIILITHKLKEIKAIADRCTVIRRGKYVGTVDVKESDEARMAEMMVGRQVSFEVEKAARAPGETILKTDGPAHSPADARATRSASTILKSMPARFWGIAGVEGNGQTELVEAITGLRRIESGSITIKGKEISQLPIHQRIMVGMAHIPEDRQKRGLVLDYSIEENLILETHRDEPFSTHGFLNHEAIRSHADELIAAFDVRSGEGAISQARAMSGGNQQKAIIAREFDLNPEILIAVQPTRGLDVGSIEYIHKRLVEQRDSGKGRASCFA